MDNKGSLDSLILYQGAKLDHSVNFLNLCLRALSDISTKVNFLGHL